MSSVEMSHVDLEQGNHHHHQHHNRSVTGSTDISLCFSDADDGTASCYSHFYSTNGGSYDDYTFSCVSDSDADADAPEEEFGVADDSAGRVSSATDCSVEVVDIQNGVPEIKVHLAKVERDCRICHLGLESDSHESGVPIELGCSCKNDLAAAHKNCAETWFKIKGNRTCEICHSIARNVHSGNEDTTETLTDNTNVTATASTITTPVPSSEPRRFWHGHRFLNFLLACMVFAFVISWLFHFNVPSS